ncbi:hypothetical protein EA187_19080 [Lujinxingia sediminis]|uniref:Uncharacterized protein n=1 Tax=Lujinxingia sediminis TaxID=2480984 RepID=A0ABY0CNB6_9DELT|nr:hypothetical protein [Lujinxingia sediminis]RVU41446.1 hypothetical protein EA187_19080 [Lujinxingia sediminis]
MTKRSRDKTVNAALEALDAAQLRELIRELLPWLHDRARPRVEAIIVERATRPDSGWTPDSPGSRRAEKVEAFAAAAVKAGYAESGDVDDHLRDGTHAFLAGDYQVAARIFKTLLIPMERADFHVGQDGQVDDVLGVDAGLCARQFAVATYMTSSVEDRARAVFTVMRDVGEVGRVLRPLEALEQIAREPLPDFERFLADWFALLEAQAFSGRERGDGAWLREVTLRLHGEEGLAEVARRSRRHSDYRAWCRLLKERKDWAAARAAYEEAAERVEADAYYRGELLDGAALAAQELGAADHSEILERAWKVAPTLERLQRWLGQCATREELVARAEQAFAAVPARAERLRALLLVLTSKFDEAAQLLEEAEGIGWSYEHHPGPVIFDVFAALLAGEEVCVTLPDSGWALRASSAGDTPTLKTPELNALLTMAELAAPEDEALRDVMRAAMRRAAARRVDEVAAYKERDDYRHAAGLVVRCARVESSPEAEAWMRGIMEKYRRFSSLKKAFREAGA